MKARPDVLTLPPPPRARRATEPGRPGGRRGGGRRCLAALLQADQARLRAWASSSPASRRPTRGPGLVAEGLGPLRQPLVTRPSTDR